MGQNVPPAYDMLLVNLGREPRPQKSFDPPRAGIVTSETYGGDAVTLEVLVVARSGPWLAVRQDTPDWPAWIAWVPAERVRPA